MNPINEIPTFGWLCNTFYALSMTPQPAPMIPQNSRELRVQILKSIVKKYLTQKPPSYKQLITGVDETFAHLLELVQQGANQTVINQHENTILIIISRCPEYIEKAGIFGLKILPQRCNVELERKLSGCLQLHYRNDHLVLHVQNAETFLQLHANPDTFIHLFLRKLSLKNDVETIFSENCSPEHISEILTIVGLKSAS